MLSVRALFGIGLLYLLLSALVFSLSTAFADNSKFYGTFDMTLSGTEPTPWTESATLTIGKDQGRMAEEGYLHVPSSGVRVTNAWTEPDGAPVDQIVTITGDTIRVDESHECFGGSGALFLCLTRDMAFAFSNNYDSAVITGTIWSDDPTENQGAVTGELTRSSGGGGGGGCFVGTITQDLQ